MSGSIERECYLAGYRAAMEEVDGRLYALRDQYRDTEGAVALSEFDAILDNLKRAEEKK